MLGEYSYYSTTLNYATTLAHQCDSTQKVYSALICKHFTSFSFTVDCWVVYQVVDETGLTLSLIGRWVWC